jgi:PPP family 3-phenylpropionic acid transporter
MGDLRVQYFLTYCVMGAVLPFASLVFRQAGLSDAQIGYAWAVWSGAVVLSPVLVTFAADARVDPRRLLALASALTGAALLALGLVRGAGPVLAVWAVYCLASLPVLPLQDGVHFSEQRRRKERGEPERPYHLVRVWGTVGFIIPSILLFVLFLKGVDLRAAPWTGAACAALAAAQALLLADPRPGRPGAAGPEAGGERRLPTVAAARALLRPHLLVFTAAVVLLQMASSVHTAYYPIYLTERVGLDKMWVGVSSNLAVFIEIFFVSGCALLVRRLGVKRLLLLATVATALRYFLIASSGSVPVAFGTQVFHGIFLVAVGVLPQIILDPYAEDRFRHSMQGLFVMLTGSGRVVASVVAGQLAAGVGIGRLYGYAAVLCLVAAGLILFAYREPAQDRAASAPGAACDAGADEPPLVPTPTEAA